MIKDSLENTIIESIDLHKKIFHISRDINKAIKTQARMMKRRDIKQNKHDRELLQEIYNNTIEQRKKNRVKVGNMKI